MESSAAWRAGQKSHTLRRCLARAAVRRSNRRTRLSRFKRMLASRSSKSSPPPPAATALPRDSFSKAGLSFHPPPPPLVLSGHAASLTPY